jgi:hypothetical protein
MSAPATTIRVWINGRPAPDAVEQASLDSFPASDPPAYTAPTGIGAPPDHGAEVWPLPDKPPVEVHEHPISDPTCP